MRWFLGVPLLLVLAWCVVPGARLLDVYPAEGMVRPGQAVHLQVEVDRPWYDPRPVTVTITSGLASEPVATLKSSGGAVEWVPTGAGGYGVTAILGKQKRSTAIDVGENWAEKPRYGFLSDFGPQHKGHEERFRTMARFHINGLQFYDWHYRHSDYLPPATEYRDPLGRLLSKGTLLEKLELSKRYGMAAMAYTAVYAAPKEFYEAHKDWALYDAGGKPLKFGNDFLFIMNPQPGSAWANHTLAEYGKIITDLPFDGIHLDQFGDPRYGYTADGAPVDVAAAIAGLIDATRARVGAKTVFFNDVGGWPMQDTAPTAKDAVYVEVWPPHVHFQHLHELILDGRRRSGGKPVVLAAYLSPAFEPSVLLTDAVIFASGGYHLEIGEGAAMLYDPYFPKNKQMSDDLQEHLRRYYDVIVRYQDLLYARERVPWEATVEVERSRVLPGAYFNGVWPLGWQVGARKVLHLINLNGLSDAKWNSGRLEGPPVLEHRRISVSLAKAPEKVYLIDPDGPDQAPRPLAFTYRDGQVQVQLDRLAYWSLLVFED